MNIVWKLQKCYGGDDVDMKFCSNKQRSGQQIQPRVKNYFSQKPT